MSGDHKIVTTQTMKVSINMGRFRQWLANELGLDELRPEQLRLRLRTVEQGVPIAEQYLHADITTIPKRHGAPT